MKRFLLILFAILTLILPVNAEEITNDAKLEYNHGIDFYKNGEYDKAMASFRRAINLSPDYIDAYYNLGCILEYLKQYDYALEMFKQIILRNPDDEEAIYKAGSIAVKLGKYKEANEYLNLLTPQSRYYKDAIKLLYKVENSTNFNTRKANETNLYEGLSSPTGVVSDAFGNIYVAHFNQNSITKIDTDDVKTTYIKNNKINGPIGMAIDLDGNLYVANYNANNVVKIKQNKEISVLIGNLKQPYGLFLRGNVLYISLQGQNSVLKYRLKV